MNVSAAPGRGPAFAAAASNQECDTNFMTLEWSTASYDAHLLRNRRVKESVCAQVDFVNGSAFREPCC
jgi:hypothetical protein